jgi:chromosome segregation ATPase
MRSRDKILISLFIATLASAMLFPPDSSNHNKAVLWFGSLFFYRGAFITDVTSLWYGGISLFTIIMIVVVFKAARTADLRAFRERLAELGAAQTDAENTRPSLEVAARQIHALQDELRERDKLLQRGHRELRSRVSVLADKPNERMGHAEKENELREELKKKTDLLQAKHSAVTELEHNLSMTRELLQTRSNELEALKSQVKAIFEQLADVRLAKERADNVLQQELTKKTKLLQVKDSAIEQLENRLIGAQELSQSRSRELEAVKSNVITLTHQLVDARVAKERVENVLHQELKNKAKVLETKDSAIAELEKSLGGTVHALKNQLSEKQELLQSRTRELNALALKMNTISERLISVESANEQADSVLHRELDKKTELLQAKDVAIKELQESLSAEIFALREQSIAKDNALKDHAVSLDALQSKVNSLVESGLARERAKSLLMQELQNRTELLQSKDHTVKELQKRLSTAIQALENAQTELERLAKQRVADFAGFSDELTESAPAKQQAESLLRRHIKGLNARLHELGAAKARAAALLPQAARRGLEANDSTTNNDRAGENMTRVQDRAILLPDKDEL